MPEKAFSVCIKDSVFIDAGRDTGAVFMILPVTTVLMAIIAGIISRVNKAYNQSLFISTGSLFFALQPAALT